MGTELLPKQLKSDVRKELSKAYSIVPRKYVSLFIWIAFVLILFLISIPYVSATKKLYDTFFVPDKSAGACNDRSSLFKSFFLSSESCQWVGLEGLSFPRSDKSVVRPNITKNFLGGRDIFSPIKTESDFQATLIFVPLNAEKINIALNYGYEWRLIVGNGDYNQVVMQRNQELGKQNLGKHDWVNIPERTGAKWIRPNGRLDPKKEIVLNVVSRSRKGTSIAHVTATISGYIDGAMQTQDFDFEYNVETVGYAGSNENHVGIGLLDPFNEGIETQLISFELHKLYINN